MNDLFPRLMSYRHQRSGRLEKGLQYQLALARAVIAQPKLILLDEPSAGLTREEENQLVDILAALTKDYQISVLLMDKNLSFIKRVADTFTLLQDGRSVLKGTAAQLQQLSDNQVWQPASQTIRVM